MAEIFTGGGKWFKGNLHTHTTLSDGVKTPDEAIKIYKGKGYDFLAITDHWRQSVTEFSDNMLLLSGCEFDTGDMVNTRIFHIVGVGMDRPVALEHRRDIEPQRIIDAVNAAGGAAVLAHPSWSEMLPQDILKTRGIIGAEVYNSVSTLPWSGRKSDSSNYFDLWASQGDYIRCLAADDTHWYAGDETKSYIMLKAESLSRDSVLAALRAGNFYASQGPVITSLDLSGDKVSIRCSQASTAIFCSNTVWCEDRLADCSGGYAEYTVKNTDRFVRVELIGKDGAMAWTSPLPVGGRV